MKSYDNRVDFWRETNKANFDTKRVHLKNQKCHQKTQAIVQRQAIESNVGCHVKDICK